MDFGFSPEQEMLREQVQRFVTKDCPMQAVRDIAAGNDGQARLVWSRGAELGLPALIVPEEYGGIGLGWIDLLGVLEELGRGLVPLPLWSQALAAAAISTVGSDTQKRAWLPNLAGGDSIWTLALYDESNWVAPEAIAMSGRARDGGVVLSGTKAHVANGAIADQVLIAFHSDSGLGLARIETSKIASSPQPVMDATKPSASLVLDDCFVPAEDIMPLSDQALSRLNDLGALAVTAETVGAAEAALAMTSSYAQERVQFGKPIGQYQGVKHRLADMYVDIESWKSLVYYAAWAADEAPAELPRAVSLAKGYASDAFARIGIECVGLHGAIGYTDEYDIQLYLKRAKWARAMFGDSDFHLDRVAALGGLQ